MSEWTDRFSTRRLAFAGLHLIPLLLASTNFTLVAFPIRHGFQWEYAKLAYASGWGYVYQSEYSLPQVLTYLLAYGSGAALYRRLTWPMWLGRIAASVCVIGFASFAIEASHWVFDHHLSFIASLPILMIPIAVWTVIRWRGERPPPDLTASAQVGK